MSQALSSDTSLPHPPTVNLRELAVQLRVSRQTLSAWLDKWPDFPHLTRGTNGREWVFDAAAVIDFLKAKRDAQMHSRAARDQALAQLTFPGFDADDGEEVEPGLSLKDRIEAVKLRKLEREEAERASKLVPAAEVSEVLVTCFTQLNRSLRNAMRQAARDHNLPDAVMRSLEGRMGEAQRDFVRQAASLLKAQPSLDAVN